MVLCLVTLTDLQTRRAGLSASAELLVYFIIPSLYFIRLWRHIPFGWCLTAKAIWRHERMKYIPGDPQ